MISWLWYFPWNWAARVTNSCPGNDAISANCTNLASFVNTLSLTLQRLKRTQLFILFPRNSSCIIRSPGLSDKYADKKAVLSQRWPRNAPYRCPEIFWDSLTTPTALCPTFSWAFVSINPMNMFLQNLKSEALPVPQIIGGNQKNWAVPGYAHAPLSPKFFNGLLFG